MPNYQKGKIYKITGTDDGKELIYIGSTTLTLCQRLAGHKDSIKRGNNHSSKQVVLCNDCLITLIELFPCNSKEELLMKERYYYNLYDCINKLKPFRFKEEEKEYKKEYYEENKQQLSEYKKEYYEENKEQIAERQKKYYEENKEQIAERQKKYRYKNKEQLAKKKKEQTTCECGCIITKSHLAKHKKTKKHIEYCESQL